MSGFIVEHTVNELHYRNEINQPKNIIQKRTEELHEQKEDGEIKRQYKEGEGNQYMDNVRMMHAETILIGRQKNNNPRAIIGFDPATKQYGIWKVDANGNKTAVTLF